MQTIWPLQKQLQEHPTGPTPFSAWGCYKGTCEYSCPCHTACEFWKTGIDLSLFWICSDKQRINCETNLVKLFQKEKVVEVPRSEKGKGTKSKQFSGITFDGGASTSASNFQGQMESVAVAVEAQETPMPNEEQAMVDGDALPTQCSGVVDKALG